MCVLNITLKCTTVPWFFAWKYNLLYICSLIRQPAKLLNFAKIVWTEESFNKLQLWCLQTLGSSLNLPYHQLGKTVITDICYTFWSQVDFKSTTWVWWNFQERQTGWAGRPLWQKLEWKIWNVVFSAMFNKLHLVHFNIIMYFVAIKICIM